MKKFAGLIRWVSLPFAIWFAFAVVVGFLNWFLSPILPAWLMAGIVMSVTSFMLVYIPSLVAPVDSVKLSNLVFPWVGAVLGFFAAIVSFYSAAFDGGSISFSGIILYPVAILVAGDLARKLVAKSVSGRQSRDTGDDPPLGRFLK